MPTTKMLLPLAGLGMVLLLARRRPKPTSKTPPPAKPASVPKPAPKPSIPPKREKFYPFVFKSRDPSPWYNKAIKEYTSYYDWTLPAEKYPYIWDAGEDYAIIKENPGKWVEVNDNKGLAIAFEDYLPSWGTIAFTAAGIAISLTPGVLEYYGITAGLSLIRATGIAYQIVSVIQALDEGRGAIIAQIASSLYSLSIPGGGSFGKILERKLIAQGIETAVYHMETP